MRVQTLTRTLACVAVFGAVPLSLNFAKTGDSGLIQFNEACATGDCCAELGSICRIPDNPPEGNAAEC